MGPITPHSLTHRERMERMGPIPPHSLTHRKRVRAQGKDGEDRSNFSNALQIRTDPDGNNAGRKYFLQVRERRG